MVRARRVGPADAGDRSIDERQGGAMKAFIGAMIIAALAAGVVSPSPAAAQATAEIEALRQELGRLQERLRKLEEAQSRPVPAAPSTPAPSTVQATPPAPRPDEREIQLDREHPLEMVGLAKPEVAGFRLSGFFAGSASYNSHVLMVPEFAGGGPALADPDSVNFRFDKFSFGVAKTFASWLSAGATIEVESHRDRHTHGSPTFGCPDPVAFCFERFGAEEAETEIELHRFHVTGVVPIGNGLGLSFGRFDTPFGIERHDPNLLLTATNSELFQFGRPNSMTGFQAAYQVTPWLDMTTWVANRWENDTTHDPFDDNNHAKSFGGRLGVTPFASGGRIFNVGLGG